MMILDSGLLFCVTLYTQSVICATHDAPTNLRRLSADNPDTVRQPSLSLATYAVWRYNRVLNSARSIQCANRG